MDTTRLLRLAGPCLLALGLGWGLITWLDVRGSVPADATVVAIERKSDPTAVAARDQPDPAGYVPVVRFTTPDGTAITARSRFAYERPPYAIGDEVRILYMPDQPRWVRFDTAADTWAAPVILSAAGVILMAFAALRRGRAATA